MLTVYRDNSKISPWEDSKSGNSKVQSEPLLGKIARVGTVGFIANLPLVRFQE